jgi:hypothetical protein
LKVTILSIPPKSKWSEQEWIPKLRIHEQFFSQSLSVSFSFFIAHSTLNHVWWFVFPHHQILTIGTINLPYFSWSTWFITNVQFSIGHCLNCRLLQHGL